MTVVVDNVGQEEDKENEINLLMEQVRETKCMGTNEGPRVALIGKMPHDNNASTNHSQKNQKMYNRCLRECGGDETEGLLHFRESLAKKKKARRQRKAKRQRGGEEAKEDQGNKEQVHETKRVGTNERPRAAPIGKMPHDNLSSNHLCNNKKIALQFGGDEGQDASRKTPVAAPVASPPVGGGVPLETPKGVVDTNGEVLLNVTIRLIPDGPKFQMWLGDGTVSVLEAKLYCVCVGWQTDRIGWVRAGSFGDNKGYTRYQCNHKANPRW
jgi:hypothetical protein